MSIGGQYSPPSVAREIQTATMKVVAVQNRSTMTIVEVKAKLGITGAGEDVDVQLNLDSAKEYADRYMRNPFTSFNDDGVETEDAIPSAVELGVLRLSCLLYSESYAEVATSIPAGASLKSVKTGDLAEAYGSASGDADDARNSIHQRFFDQYRFTLGFTYGDGLY